MALDSDWFAGSGPPDYTDIRCNLDVSGASMVDSTVDGSWHRYEWGPCDWLVFLPNKRGGPDGLNLSDAEYGYVYGKNDSGGTEQGLHYIQHGFRSAPATSASTGNYMARPFGTGGSGTLGA
ncbi:hypothetical protein DRQ53_15555, partial [bacterium]